MKQDRNAEGRLSAGARGLGTVTQRMVRERARELAIIAGRSEHDINETDFEQALRELTGAERLTPTSTAAEELTEDARWDPNPQSSGSQAPTVPAPDEQTFAEKLVEEGVADAEHDQMVQATKQSAKRDRLPQ